MRPIDHLNRWFIAAIHPYPTISHEDTPADKVLFIGCEIALQILFSWTLAYHLCVVLQLPTRLIFIPFLLILAGLGWLSMSRWKRTVQGGFEARWFVFASILLGAVLGLFNLIVSRPDADDVQYFYRALLQLNLLDQPFILTEMIHNVPHLPLSSTMSVTSYYLFVAMVANAFCIDPLFAFHNLAPFMASIFLIIIYVLVYRQFGLDRRLALAATFLLCAFLLIDGNVHRSFGNVTILRLWQGKTIMWTLLIPLSLLTSYRYMENPRPARLFLVLMTAVSALGLSSSGLFLIPAMIFAVSLAFVLNHGPTWDHLKRAVLVNLASIYNASILIAMLFDWLPTYPLDEMFVGWPSTWTGNIGLVVDSKLTLARNLILLLAVPAVFLSKPYHRFFVTLTIVLIALFTNPVISPLFLKVLQAGAYWRLAYLFPLPLCAGLLALAFMKLDLATNLARLRVGVAVLAVTAIVLPYEHSTLTPGEGMVPVWLKNPISYRFPPREYSFCAAIADKLDGRNLLAPERIIHILPLLNSTIRLETARLFQTRFAFKFAGMAAEGARRVIAQLLVTDCRRSAKRDAAFLQSIEGGIDAVVLGRCNPIERDRMIELLKSTNVEWIITEESQGYTLLIRQ